VDTATLNAAVLSVHGESGGVVLHVSDGASPPVITDVPLGACFRGPWSGISLEGAPVELQDTQLLFVSADFDATDAKTGDTVTVRGEVYTLLDPQPDDGGMTLVTVKVYRAAA